jgi:hypothetical protein
MVNTGPNWCGIWAHLYYIHKKKKKNLVYPVEIQVDKGLASPSKFY